MKDPCSDKSPCSDICRALALTKWSNEYENDGNYMMDFAYARSIEGSGLACFEISFGKLVLLTVSKACRIHAQILQSSSDGL